MPNRTYTDLYFVNDSIGFIIGSEYIYKSIDSELYRAVSPKNTFSSIGDNYASWEFISKLNLNVESYPKRAYLAVIIDSNGKVVKSHEIILY